MKRTRQVVPPSQNPVTMRVLFVGDVNLTANSVSGEAASLAVKLWSQRLHIGMDSAFAATVMMIRQTKPERRKKSFRIMGDSLVSIVLDGQRDLE